jgi:hypothetical protein
MSWQQAMRPKHSGMSQIDHKKYSSPSSRDRTTESSPSKRHTQVHRRALTGVLYEHFSASPKVPQISDLQRMVYAFRNEEKH